MAWTRWEESNSRIVERYRYDEQRAILQIRSRRSGRLREFQCSGELYEQFLRTPSQGWFLSAVPPAKRWWRLSALRSRA
ncbi:MAG: hypothetical protein ACRDKH_03990 [Solirubrobacterales bacterium]